MRFATILGQWLAGPSPARVPGRRCGTRLRVERLEGRAVPANFTASNVPELIADIDAANLTPEADQIALVGGTTYTLTAVNNTEHGPTGLPVIAAGSDIIISGNGATIGRSRLRSTAPFRLLDVAAGGTLTLRDLTLQGGLASGRGEQAWGGAVYNLGELNLERVAVVKNVAQGWEGYSAFPGESALGGGVYSNGALSVIDSRFESNEAIGGAGHDGQIKAPVVEGPVTTIPATRGGAGLGGGVFVAGGTAAISGTTITANSATGGAGGDGIIGYNSYTGSFVSPAAAGGKGLGGGLYVAGGAVSLHAVTTTSNHAQGGSGGAGVKGAPDGAPGHGKGGGIFLAPEVFAELDGFSVTNTRKNSASTADANISGP
jgi:hypothetical protein